MRGVPPPAVDHDAADRREVVVGRQQSAVCAELLAQPQRAGDVAGAADEQLVAPVSPVEFGARCSLDEKKTCFILITFDSKAQRSTLIAVKAARFSSAPCTSPRYKEMTA